MKTELDLATISADVVRIGNAYKDVGTSVTGMRLLYKGQTVCKQRFQGSISNEQFFTDVINFAAVYHNLPKRNFNIVYGRMD